MHAISTNLKACHPERSTTVSEASRRAQSKNPYVAIVFCDCIEASARRSLAWRVPE